jgi:hypothetical protein
MVIRRPWKLRQFNTHAEFTTCHGVETAASKLFESVSEYEVSDGSDGLRNTRITLKRRNGLS